MGITQSAVYRHVRNMDELAGLAAGAVVAELNQSLRDILVDPDIDWEEIDDVGRLCRTLVDQAVRNQRSFEVVARWRFAGGALGNGIDAVIEEGVDLVAALLETRWRVEFGGDTLLDRREQHALRAHARALYDDSHALALLASSSAVTPLDLDDVATIMVHRVIAGWASFVIDLNQRVGLPFPEIDLARGVIVG
jgi:AcrR family transcriptional regulator